jgi:uncharacterized membrane protein YdjX (TVP38/TMEM64 family)
LKDHKEHNKLLRIPASRVFKTGIFFLLLAVLAAGFVYDVSIDFSVVKIEETIRSWGAWGVAASIALMVLHSFIPFPAELVAIANGMIYGIFWGIVITWIGAMLGALLAFALARRLGRPLVERIIAQRNWQSVDDWAALEGGRIVLLARFFPVIAFNLINYAAGLSRLSWWTFTWATGIGILPLTVLMVAMGDYIEVLPWWVWLLVAVVCVVVCFLFRKRLRPQQQDS